MSKGQVMAIVERTHYFAKAGKAGEVLKTRQRACAVRLSLGLPAGDIMVRTAGDDGSGPDVVWTCRFADKAAHEADLAGRAASSAFEEVRARMRGLIERFERQLFEEADLALASGLRDTPLAGHPVVPREIAFDSGGHRLKGYLHLPPGRGPFPLMITNHGSGIDKGTEDVSRPGTASVLAGWGIASFLPHRRGYGNSTGPGWREEVNAEFGSDAYDQQLAARLDAESDDILAALAIVSALPQIDASHIGIMGSSFGGTTTLFAAAKSDRFTCAIDFAGAAMNWDRTPGLRASMLAAAARVRCPIFYIQAANDFSVRPTAEIAASRAQAETPVQSKIYPAFGFNHYEGHLLESRGPAIWSGDVRHFLERYL